MRDLLSGVAYLHANGIIHRDIKMENIKFSRANIFDNVKLIDFGSADAHPVGSGILHYELAGSPYYASPEMLDGKGYTEKTDVWSCGIVFYHLLVGSFPFDAKTDLEVLHKVQCREVNFIGDKFRNFNHLTLKLLKGMLIKDPSQRMSAIEARTNAFFKYDELEVEIIKEGLTNCANFLKYGQVQRGIMRLYVDKLQIKRE